MSRVFRPIEFTWRVGQFALAGDVDSGLVVINPGAVDQAEKSRPVCRVNFVVKLLRAHGGCLGRSRR
jgi:hypothetical protein